jgi:hypothetical protein
MRKKGPSKPTGKCSFESPTTKGLYVTIQAYIIELICLNMNNKLGPRFWREDYWRKKFTREVRGVKLLLDELSGATNPIFQKALFKAIKKIGCQSFLRGNTRTKIIKYTKGIYWDLKEERQRMVNNASTVKVSQDYMKHNAVLVTPPANNKLDKLRSIENGKEKTDI